ncbi:nuclear transport factor 2 family protein [Aquimarina sp. LLG6339-5]|uniref:nuclear transport factor 2 family protein n=1 Tax=Aquimarina sp. LLG6339-5 TaxID=3160830 RepID=UPI003864EFD9
MKHFIIGIVSLAFLISCNNKSKSESDTQKNTETEVKVIESSKDIVKKGMDALFKDFDEITMRAYFHKDYIQHNPHVPSGLEPVIGLLPALKEANFGYTTHRMIQDGDLVLTHTSYQNAMVFGAKEVVAFNIWRVTDGKITEHWDAIIPKFDKTASGRSQTDGMKIITDKEKTDENKTIVKGFVTEALMKEDFSKMDNYVRNGVYDQHNPLVNDGLEALRDVIAVSGLKNNQMHKVIGEGNFVLTQCEGIWNGKPQAIYDLFRVADGTIVEHWDVIQEIPTEMAHNNGMF